MLLLVLFALAAGAATALTPCVLPVLPALLSASGTGGRRRPLGVVLGLTLTHFVTIVGLATVVDGVGLGDGTIRSFAVIVLFAFGVALLVPALGDRVEARLSGLARFGPKGLGDGFVSGLGVGGALGFVFAPCAGPILAGVISVSATQGATGEIVLVAAAYSIGSGATLLLLAFGGRSVVEKVRARGRGPMLQRGFGVVMVLTAIAMATQLDVRFQTTLADRFPAFVVNPTRGLERTDRVAKELNGLRGESRFDVDRARPSKAPAGARAASLPPLGDAPDFTGTQKWFNTGGGRKLSLKRELKGRVVLIDFWTYTCINCIRTFPFVKALDRRYRDDGLTVVGVHTPEFAFEKKADNVKAAIEQNALRYPIAQDNDFATWNAYGNQYWPAKYLIDAKGQVRYTHFGEGGEAQTETAVRALLVEAGDSSLAKARPVALERPSEGVETPETYLGAERAERFLPDGLKAGTTNYPGVPADQLIPSHFALSGLWTVDAESARAGAGARLDALFTAEKVFLVLSSPGGEARKVEVLVDGKPVTARQAGEDVEGGVATIRGQRLYRLVDLPEGGTHRLTLRPEPGVTGFAFTFG